MGGTQRGGDEIVEMRGVAEEEDDGEFLVFGEFAEELERFGAGEELVGFADLVFGVGEFVGEDFRGLKGAEIGAGEQKIRRGSDFGDTFGDLAGLFDSLLREKAIRVGRTVGVFAIDGNAVADDVELHGVGSSEEFTRGMFRLDDGAAGCVRNKEEEDGKKDLTQSSLRTLSALRRGEWEKRHDLSFPYTVRVRQIRRGKKMRGEELA